MRKWRQHHRPNDIKNDGHHAPSRLVFWAQERLDITTLLFLAASISICTASTYQAAAVSSSPLLFTVLLSTSESALADDFEKTK